MHLQAVALFELILLFLREVTDESVEIGNHVFIHHKCLRNLSVMIQSLMHIYILSGTLRKASHPEMAF